MRPNASTIAIGAILATLALLPFGLLASSWHHAARTEVPQLVWGQRGVTEGKLLKPRGLAIDGSDRIYIVDMTARVQIFDQDGKFLRGFRTPEWAQGKPTGLSIDRDGNVIVPDTHYFRVLFYTPTGELLPSRTIGGTEGTEPGQFGFVTDVVQDSRGNYYVSEYGENDRIQMFTGSGEFVLQWGSHGSEPGEFRRPQSLSHRRR